MNISRILLLLFSISTVCFNFLDAQENNRRWTQYGAGSELGTSMVYDILQDKNGFIWLATETGIWMFDGHSFKSYSDVIRSSFQTFKVRDIEYDSSQHILYGVVQDGAFQLNLTTGLIKDLDLDLSTNKWPQELSMSADGNLYIRPWNRGNQVFQYNLEKDSTTIVDIGGDSVFITPIKVDENDPTVLWVANNLLFKYNSTVGTLDSIIHPAIDYDVRGNWITSMIQSGDVIYYGDVAGHIYGYNKRTEEHLGPFISDYENPRIRTIQSFDLKDDALLFSHDQGGLWEMNLETYQIKPFIADEAMWGEYNRVIKKIFIDREENVWVGTGEGLMVFYNEAGNFVSNGFLSEKTIDPGFYPRLTKRLKERALYLQFGYEQEVFAVYEKDLHFLGITNITGARSGVNWIGEEFSQGDQLIYYFAGEEYFYRANMTTWEKEEDLRLEAIYRFAEAPDCYTIPGSAVYRNNKIIFICDKEIVWSLDLRTLEVEPVIEHVETPHSMIVLDDQIWLDAFYEKSVYDPLRNEFAIDSTFEKYIDQEEVEIRNFVYWGPDTILISTSAHGVFIYDRAIDSIYPYDRFNKHNIEINGVFKTSSTDFVGRTNMGLVHYNGSTDEVSIIDQKMGFQLSNLIYTSVDVIEDEIIINFPEGLSRLSLKQFYDGAEDIDIYLHSVNGKTDLNSQELTFKHNENSLAFYFTSLNYNESYRIRYEYQLLPLVTDWEETSAAGKLDFKGLSPGDYTLNLRGILINGDYTDVKTIMIEIIPPWYQTLWFKIMLGIIGIMATVGLTTLYQRNKNRNLLFEKRLAQLETMVLKSQMNPHFIFNSLNSIRYLFMKDQKDKGLRYITKFARLLRTTLHLGDEAMVKLKDEIELTELYIELEQLRFEDNFVFIKAYEQPGDWENVMIPPFVIQPLVENAFWHGLQNTISEDKRLKVEIIRIQNGYEIIVEDNGPGFNNSKSSLDPSVNKNKSYGLSVIRERFDLINRTQSFHYELKTMVSSSFDSGAKIIVEVTKP